jgi:two-component system, cell cycle sensor histidine kinase and response regulator CckA
MPFYGSVFPTFCRYFPYWLFHAAGASPFAGKSGDALRRAVSEVMNDTSDTKIQLRDAEAKYRGMFENAIEGIYQSSPDGRYLAVNAALARMYGYESPEEMMSQVSDIQAQIYVDPAFRKRFKQEIESAGIVRALEYQVRRRDGSALWISESARVVRGADGTIRYYEGFIEDIDERKTSEAERARLEKQVLQSQKMDALGTLASGMAHDFNNVLCAILGYTELALLDPQISGKTRENLDMALRSAERARDLIKRILSFSRPAAAQYRPLKISPILEEAIKLLNATLPSSIEIHLEIRTNDDVVLADASDVHQVIMNLGVNAKHAMSPKGGRLEYILGVEDLDAAPAAKLALTPGPYVHFQTRDTGHGMSREVLERVFEPFFTTKPAGRGTGLGLTFVHKMVTRCQGRIDVESEEGKGTTFHIYLPQSPEPAVPLVAPAQNQILPGHREQILVVDDEVFLLSLMQQRLRSMGYRVITRADSVSAMEDFSADPRKFALVITDHTMPTLQGADLAEKLGDIRPDLPVILVTGLEPPPDLSRSRYAPLRAVVSKPIDFVQLSHRLRQFLDKPHHAKPRAECELHLV